MSHPGQDATARAEAKRRAFIVAQTQQLPVPHAPALRLHVAHESMPLWRKTEEELGAIGLPPPYWAFAWAGGQALARHVLDHPAVVAGRRVLDFAAGSGLVGIAAAKAGAASVVCADIDPFAIAAIGLNSALNGVDVRALEGDLIGEDQAWETVLAGDICYERALAARVTEWLKRLAVRGADVLIGDPGRAYLPKAELELLACYDVPVTRDLEDSDIKTSCVWRLRR